MIDSDSNYLIKIYISSFLCHYLFLFIVISYIIVLIIPISVSPVNLFLLPLFTLGFPIHGLVSCHALDDFNKCRALNTIIKETPGIVILHQKRVIHSSAR